MPVAAIPAYIPEKLLAEASPGLRFGMYLKLWDAKFNIPPENKRAALNESCKLTALDRRTMQALARRQQALAGPLVGSGGLMRLEAVAIAPFTTGLGNEHPLENGFAFLNPYGLPYLPGSGVKGVVQQAACELASGDWGETRGWNRDDSYPLKIGKKEIRLSLLDVLFGRKTPSGESEHVRGALSFWDVVPQIAGERLVVEVMTPHQTHYYQNGENPHESKSPTPINFLTVPPKSRFTFHVQCDRAHLRRVAPALAEEDRWKEMVEAAFAHAFQWLGLGAKTAVGYGAFALATGPVGIGGRTSETGSAEKLSALKPEMPGETEWDRARLQYNVQNGTLIATGPKAAKAYAYNERGRELFSRLPADLQQKVRTNPFNVHVIARVRGPELITVEPKP
jgi:CRISPR-associated protein Cmr6